MSATALALLTPAYTLNINVQEEPSLSQFRLSLHYDDDFKTALLLNFTKRNVLFKNSRFLAEIALGENPRGNIHYFLDRGLVPSVGLDFRANRFRYRVYDENRNAVALTNYFDFSTDLFLQSTLYDVLAVGTAIEFDGVSLSEDLAKIQTDTGFSSYINYYGFIDFDSFNSANYPTKGTKFSASYRIIGKHEKFQKFYQPSSVLDISLGQAITLNHHFALVAHARLTTTIGQTLDYPYNIFLGSMGKNYINYITPFIGYRYMELVGRNALTVRADLYYQFVKKHYIIIRANAGKLENSFQNTIQSDIILDGYSLGYSYESPIGPIEINVYG